MKPKEALGLIVRAFGLWTISKAAYHLAFVLGRIAGMQLKSDTPLAEYVMWFAVDLVYGIGVVIAAPLIVRFAYPPELP
jgi:hypothetical protein